MAQRDGYILSPNGTMRRDMAAGPRSPFASALKTLSEAKPKAATAAPKVTPPAQAV